MSRLFFRFYASTFLLVSHLVAAAGTPPISFNPKEIEIAGDLGPFQTSWTVKEENAGIRHATLTLKSQKPASIPPFQLKWRIPAIDVAGVWASDTGTSKFDHERVRVESRAVQRAPVLTYFNQGDQNRITMALSDAMNPILLKGGIREEDAFLYMTLELFRQKTPPVREYSVTLRFDTRSIPYEEALRDTVRWWAAMDNHTPAPVPTNARVPVYSTWYSYHQNFTADEIAAECELGGKLGLRGVIVDDGWQTMDGNRGYAFTGDWKPDRIPDMKAFVDRIHALDQIIMLWYSVPMAGDKSEIIKRFRDKTLYYQEGFGAHVLDPRYPEVREYLIGIYEAAVRDWGIDGLKLDFIGMFSDKGGKDLTAENGRDYASVDKAVDRLMSDIMKRLRALRPDIAIEFRQPYNGPLMRKYGNMFRAVDCPNCAPVNRKHIVDLRLIADTTAVHSDMIMWNPDEPVESAALQVLNILFSVPQISVKFGDLSPKHQQMLAFWMKYWTENRETLLDGEFRAASPAQNYPMVMSCKDGKLIAAVYQEMFVPTGKTTLDEIDVINGKSSAGVVVRFDSPFGKATATVLDACGKVVSEQTGTFAKGAHAFDVPPSGLLMIWKAKD